MTFKQLEALCWIARLGGFSEAAAKLHTTQSAISKRVQELELLVGVELFDRTSRSARLTEKGEEMFAVACRLLDQRDSAIAQFSRAGFVERRIRIGVTELTAMTWFPRFVDAFQRANGHVIIEPNVDMGLTLREKVLSGETDIAFVPDGPPDSRLAAKSLGKVENAWMCKPGLITGRRPTRLHQLANYRLLTQGQKSGTGFAYARWLQQLNVQPTDTLICNNLIALLALTVSGLGISYLPRRCLSGMQDAGMLETVDVKPALPPVKYVALCRTDRQSALHAAVIRLAQEYCDFTLMFQTAFNRSHAAA